MSRFDINSNEFYKLESTLKAFEGDVEKEINYVLHNEAGDILDEEIHRLMPYSGRSWKGKRKPAKNAKNSLKQKKDNLAITVRTSSNYNYLWFPDDGQNVRNPKRRAAGNQQFFRRSGENKTKEIIDRCIGRLADALNK